MSKGMRVVLMALRMAVVKALFTGRLAPAGRRGVFFGAVLAFAWLSALPLMAANKKWQFEGPTTGNWSTAANWEGGEPTAADGAYFGFNGLATNGIAEVTASGEAASCLYLGAWNTNQSGTLIISGGSLTIGAEFYINDGGATGIVNQTGGTLTAGSVHVGRTSLKNGSQQMYTMSGGTLITPDLVVCSYNNSGASTGVFNQSGGTVCVSNGLALGYSLNGLGIYRLTGGSILLTNACTLSIGSSQGLGEFYMGDTNGTGSIEGGAGAKLLFQWHSYGYLCKFQGWGTVTMAGTLETYCRVIADGYGTDRNLDMSSFTNLVAGDNTTTNGWYAQNRGKLILPKIPVTADAAYYWGDNNGPDMVNGAKLTFSGVTVGGAVAGALLSLGRADTDARVNNAETIGLWEFTATNDLAFGTMTPVFRYDDALVTQKGLEANRLKIWHKTGATWEALAATVDTGTKRITAVQSVSTLGQFAVAFDLMPPNLIGAWRFDGDFTDASGHGYTGISENGAAIETPGKIGSGTLNHVTAIHGGRRVAITNNTPGTESFTAVFWMNVAAYNYGEPFGKVTNAAPNGWQISMRSDPTVWLRIGGSDGQDVVYLGTTWSTGVWQHIVISYDGVNKRGRFYRDGVRYGGYTSYAGTKSTSNSVAQLHIGQLSAAGGNTYAFMGNLDDVALWGEVLSDTRIKVVYNLGNSTLNYGVADAQALFEIYAGGPGACGTARGKQWGYVTGLSGSPGDVVGGNAVVLGTDGSGVRLARGTVVSFR